MSHRARGLVALIGVLALVGAACGGGKKAATPTATGSLAGTTITLSTSLAQSEVGSLPDVLSLFKQQTGVNVKTTQVTAQVLPSMIPDKFDGKQYFLPFRPNVRVTYVNKDRFQSAGVQPPTTTDEYKAVAEKLKAAANGQGKVTLSLADQPDTGPLGVTMSEWIVSYGGNPLIMNDDGSVQAITFLQGLWKEGVFAKESLQAKD